MRDLARTQGGDLRRFRPGQIAVDLSMCGNRLGPSPAAIGALHRVDERDLVAPFYEGGNDDLEDDVRDNPYVRAYAEHLGRLNPRRMVVARGVTEMLHVLARLWRGEDVGLVTPEYSETLRLFDYATVHHPTTPRDSPEARMERVREALQAHQYVIVSNPSNPLGHYLDRQELLDACAQHPQSMLVVDETYVEFQGEHLSLASVVPRLDNLVILQSTGKPYGLAATRAGILWTRDDALRKAIAREIPRFTLSLLDARAASAALHDQAWLEQSMSLIRSDGRRLEELLVERFGAGSVATCQIHWRFVYAQRPKSIHEHLVRHKVATRLFDGERLGEVRGVRITAPHWPGEWERLTAALDSLPASAR